ncbi:MAG: hypothetical protein IJZ94_03375 [Clostridia bacterium]|nr:hypothetical protein [Clostridia bacterium]
MDRKLIIISKKSDDILKNNLKKLGHVFELSENVSLSEFESCHPDMQICKINDSFCVVSPDIDNDIIEVFSEYNISYKKGETFLSEKYPKNIAYNVLIGDKIFIHNIDYTDKLILKYLFELNKKAVCVKQGYSGCSSIFVKDIILTSDYGVYKKAVKENIKTILFRNPELIKLHGFEHGFLGGCCGYSDDTGLLINCSSDFLPEYFINELVYNGINFKCIGAGELTDIGGIIIFTGHL